MCEMYKVSHTFLIIKIKSKYFYKAKKKSTLIK